MLVLKRAVDERIVLDFTTATDEEIARLRAGLDVIEVMVVEIKNKTPRLGVTAPFHVKVDRAEVWEAKRREAAAAQKKGVAA